MSRVLSCRPKTLYDTPAPQAAIMQPAAGAEHQAHLQQHLATQPKAQQSLPKQPQPNPGAPQASFPVSSQAQRIPAYSPRKHTQKDLKLALLAQIHLLGHGRARVDQAVQDACDGENAADDRRGRRHKVVPGPPLLRHDDLDGRQVVRELRAPAGAHSAPRFVAALMYP